MRIAMWSGPRNLSTAMMYAFSSRSDSVVIDEPFYAAYLHSSGLIHPMQNAILASQPTQPDVVIEQCLGEMPDGKSLYYQKQMTHHMLPTFSLDWLKEVNNVFLIRHPARVVASYQQKREKPTLEDIGFVKQLEIFNYVKKISGTIPVVVDSDDILENPAQVLQTLCEAIGIEYQSTMLSWTAGGNPADGVWAPHWYESVWKSTGLRPTVKKPLPELPSELNSIANAAIPYYEEIARHKITVA